MVWYTKSEWVDLETGESLTKQEVEKNYIIIKKKTHYAKHTWYHNRKREEYGIRTITNECTREGKQLTIF